jgi:hypothetical protein
MAATLGGILGIMIKTRDPIIEISWMRIIITIAAATTTTIIIIIIMQLALLQ